MNDMNFCTRMSQSFSVGIFLFDLMPHSGQNHFVHVKKLLKLLLL